MGIPIANRFEPQSKFLRELVTVGCGIPPLWGVVCGENRDGVKDKPIFCGRAKLGDEAEEAMTFSMAVNAIVDMAAITVCVLGGILVSHLACLKKSGNTP